MQKPRKSPQSIDSRILNRIYGLGRGAVVIPGDFLDLGSRRAVDLTLHRLTKKGTLRRLARGIYNYPKKHPKLGLLMPPAEAIAKALANRDKLRLQPSGAYAANLLHLSEQVPTKIVFLTEGPSRKVRIGRQEIILKRTTPKNMATAGQISGLVIQALRWLGQDHVTPRLISTIHRNLTDDDKRQLRKDLVFAPAWIADIMRKVSAETTD